MTRASISLDERLYQYLLDVSLREPDILRRLREETASYPNAEMQIAPEQGQFMALLLRLIGARRTLEIGVFTGYSSTVAALALPAGGEIVACEANEEYAAVARRYWKEAGVEEKIDLRMGPALETLDGLLADGEAGSFDFAFIDADKANIPRYYERCLRLVRPGGLIAVDNTLWSGRVADPAEDDESTRALRAFNAALTGDERIELSLLPVGDGLTLARVR
ncbi:MAG TPA: class I SAM-dependent methyltransferase [Gemmatimonadota bacterium]|nr:class I SAM-dependent methyltransferase [Gemmatimonadota bacterium]